MTPPQPRSIEDDLNQLLNAKLMTSIQFPVLAHHLLTDFVPAFPEKDDMGFGKVFYINLDRRPERRVLMEWALNELEFPFERVSAVDGKSLNESFITSIGIYPFLDFKELHSEKAR